jgi:hypothetical protein
LVPGTDGGPPINVLVDYLVPREMDTIKNSPALVGDFAAQKADSANLATSSHEFVPIPQ